MGLFTTKSCCICLSLRTGGIVLGTLVLLHGIIGTFQPIYEQIQHARYYRSMYREYGDSYFRNAYSPVAQVGTNHIRINLLIDLQQIACLFNSNNIHFVRYAYSVRTAHYIRCNCLAIWHLQGKIKILFFRIRLNFKTFPPDYNQFFSLLCKNIGKGIMDVGICNLQFSFAWRYDCILLGSCCIIFHSNADHADFP